MFEHLWILMILLFFVLLIVLTVNAVYDILKNEMNDGDTILDFLDGFGIEYPGLLTVWICVILIIFIISLALWIASRNGG